MTWISFILSSFLAGIFVILFYFGRGLPDHSSLENYDPILTNRIYLSEASLSTDSDAPPSIDKVWKDYSKERRFFIPIELVPDLVVQAFLVAEDKNFFIHPGLDLMGVFRACVKNTLTGKWKTRPMGASTITQQVAKNFLLTNERSFTRKVKEAIMAIRIERTFTKQRILELYLNQIYLGSGCYGVSAAAEYYFQKRLDELSVEEVAFLAGLPKAPEIYQTHKNPNLAKARRNWVLDRLYDEHYITGQALILAKETPIATTTKKKDDYFSGDFFLEATRQKLIEIVGQDNYTKGGYFLWTTVKPNVQRIAHTCLQKGLEAYDKRYGYRGPLLTLDEAQMTDATAALKAHTIELPPHLILAVVTDSDKDKVSLVTQSGEKGIIPLNAITWARRQEKNRTLGPEIKACADVLHKGDVIVVRCIKDDTYSLEQIPEVTGGIVVMDSETGHVHALSGGYHFAMNQHNAAIQAKRQPGSSFKPFVYLAALERGYSKETKVLDAPLYIPLGFKTKDGKTTYSPKNFSKTYYGPTSLENGLAYSRNVMTVRLAMQIGMSPIARVVKRFGIHDKLPRQLAMALGAGETTLLRLTAAYAMIANGGRKITPTLLTRIDNRDNYPI
ncbi:MAG: transglycosylase domain-containing protein, partial [Alphaproteobacteria bacterium]|nr:transglycosylase domain-containing protein [Alphaproteobacteria bacterium]